MSEFKKRFKEGIDYTNLHFVHGATGPSIWTDSILEYLGVSERGKLREKAEELNSLDSFKQNKVYIYQKYTYFRNDTGVVQHLYGSINWQNSPTYNNWINNRSQLMRNNEHR